MSPANFVRKVVAAAVAVLVAHAASAAYPERPVRLLVPYATGGNADVQSRFLALKLGEFLGQQFIVDNRAGATGLIGTELAAKAAPDGYTLLFIASPYAVNASLFSKLPFDPVRDFAPVSLVGSTPLIIAVTPDLPARNVAELIALAKAKAGQLNFASPGNGSPGQLAGVLFNTVTGTKIVHIPYKGTAQALTDLMSGQVQMMFASATSVMPHIKSGRIRGLAITSRQRSALAPDLMTTAEAGLPNYETGIWSGIVAPARTPASVIGRLHEVLVTILKRPEVREQIITLGADPQTSTPEEFRAFIAAEIRQWGKVIRDARIRVD